MDPILRRRLDELVELMVLEEAAAEKARVSAMCAGIQGRPSERAMRAVAKARERVFRKAEQVGRRWVEMKAALAEADG